MNALQVGKDTPYKDAWAQTIKEHRQYKQSLYLKGELKEEEKE